jgi:hypothetical protein
MTDRTTKLLLAAIAVGLWLNAGAAWHITPAQAQPDPLVGLLHDVHAIYNGTCTNGKVC